MIFGFNKTLAKKTNKDKICNNIEAQKNGATVITTPDPGIIPLFNQTIRQKDMVRSITVKKLSDVSTGLMPG